MSYIISVISIPNAVELYNSGFSIYEISKITCVSKSSVYRFLNNKVDFRKIISPVNNNFLEKIDSEEKAYFLGFTYADGSVHKNKDVLVFNLHRQDIELLEKFSLLLTNRNNVKIQNRIRNGKIFNHCILELYSKELKRQLIKLGCPSNKTFIITFPEWLVDLELQKHFIRGYFDGDGCFCISNNKLRIQITSNEIFLLGIKNILLSENINSQIYKRGNIYDLVIYQKEQCLNFLSWIYKGASLYLDRKYSKYINYVGSNV